MKNLLPAILLAFLAIAASAQDSEKYQKIQGEIQARSDEQDKDAEGTAEQYNIWKSRPGYRGYYEGYVVDSAGNKFEGIVKLKGDAVTLIEPSGKTRRYSSSDCREYGHGSYRFEATGSSFIQIVYDLKSIGVYKQTFAPGSRMVEGPTGEIVMVAGNQTDEVIIYYIRKKNEKNFEPVKKINFAKKFSRYFSDCPYLNENIKNKTLTSAENDLTAIAAIYDRECASVNK